MDRKQCKGCGYFIAGAGGTKVAESERFCHYMLYTGERRKVGKNEKCLSRALKKAKERPSF